MPPHPLLLLFSPVETASIDKERQAWPSCSTSESKHFLASRDLYSTLHALSARSVHGFDEVFASRNASIRFDLSSARKFQNETNRRPCCWDTDTIDWRIDYVECTNLGSTDFFFPLLIRFGIFDRGEKENEKKFSSETLHVRVHLKQQTCIRMFVTWAPNMARIKGIGQEFSTLRKKLRVLSFDSVGASFQRCFFPGTINVQLAPSSLLSSSFLRSNNSVIKVDRCFWNSFEKYLRIQHSHLFSRRTFCYWYFYILVIKNWLNIIRLIVKIYAV